MSVKVVSRGSPMLFLMPMDMFREVHGILCTSQHLVSSAIQFVPWMPIKGLLPHEGMYTKPSI
jgi:hypothetical protein